METGRFVSYLRVSTSEQGRSGLGIEAQREAVARYLNGGDWELISEYVEIESGKKNDRPKLLEALNHCKRTGAKLVIARLDRLSRNAAFITQMQESGTPFVCCDMPEATEFTITIFAALAQQERKLISERTRAALQARKAKGLTCGKDNLTDAGRLIGAANSAVARARKAAGKRDLVKDYVVQLKEQGLSLRGIAAKLTVEHIEPPRKGGTWHANSVKRILESE